MPAEETVSANEILRSAGAERPVTGGTFLQRTGLILAGFVGAAGAIVTFALVGKWVFYAPAVPVIQPGADPGVVKAIIENYRTLQQIALEPFTSLFDSIVVKVLLPVFTTILGYIFGSQSKKNEA
jgi:uncharacterized YccA/Bax inhibitor family protein